MVRCVEVSLLTIWILLGCCTGHVVAQDYDIVIEGGRVIDVESELDAIANVGIKDGKIAAISQQPITGNLVIDAKDHVVSSGFIDLHAHGQNIGDYRMQAMQGVTTMLELESGVLPISQWYEMQSAKRLPINYGASAGWTFARIATFTAAGPEATPEYFQQAQASTNWKELLATPEQSKRIMALVEEGLDQGALGIGINAGYAPGYGHKEYFELAELAAREGVPTFTHVRYASNLEPNSSFQAVQELISLAAITGAHMHLCHINSTSLKDIRAILRLVDDAQQRHINITVGAYPYGAASTVVGAAMFSGDKWRERMGSTAQNFQLGPNRLTEQQLADYQMNSPGTFINWHFLDESSPSDLVLLDMSILHPNVLIESDEMFWMLMDGKEIENYSGDEWPLPKNAFSHPRSAGAFAKILRSYVRERKLMTLPEALKKMTLMPAQALEKSVPQMKQKGRLQVGMDADIVVFDPDTIADKATYTQPNQPAVGVQSLVVNGEMVIRDGKLILDADHGRAIRRAVAK